MNGYRIRGALLTGRPEADHTQDAPAAEPRLAIAESGAPDVRLILEWDARRSVLEKLALLQGSKRRVPRLQR